MKVTDELGMFGPMIIVIFHLRLNLNKANREIVDAYSISVDHTCLEISIRIKVVVSESCPNPLSDHVIEIMGAAQRFLVDLFIIQPIDFPDIYQPRPEPIEIKERPIHRYGARWSIVSPIGSSDPKSDFTYMFSYFDTGRHGLTHIIIQQASSAIEEADIGRNPEWV